MFFVEFLSSFFQCCFKSEAQVLMTVSFFVCFSRNHFLEEGFTFQWGLSFLNGEAPHRGTSSLMEGFKKNSGMEEGAQGLFQA